jgi:hypothetical protein
MMTFAPYSKDHPLVRATRWFKAKMACAEAAHRYRDRWLQSTADSVDPS